MNNLAKFASVTCLALVAEGASAYTYISRGCGTPVGYSNISRTFNLGSNLSTAEKVDIATALSRVTVFSKATINLLDNGDNSWSTGNTQNEIYHDTSHPTAQCALNYDTQDCTVIATDIRFGNQNWVTGEDSHHAPYDTSAATGGRSILGTAVHEGGHCIGIGHEDDVYNMMGDDRTHVTRNSTTTYYGPGEDLSNGAITRWGKRSTNDAYRDVGVTVMRYTGSDGTYSSHDFGVLRNAYGVALTPSGSYEGQPAYQVVAGDTVQMELTVENNGEKDTESFSIGLYLSTNSFISTSDTLLGADDGYVQTRNVPYEAVEAVTIPVTTTPGTYYLGAYADHNNVIPEVTSANNIAYYPIEVLPPPADLTVPFAGVSDTTLLPTQSFSVVAITRNEGDGPAHSTYLRYYRSSNALISTGDTQIGTDAISALAAGAQQASNDPEIAPSVEGTYWYGACVDSVSGEEITNNQCSSAAQVTVAAVPPAVTTGGASGILTTEATLHAAVTPNGAATTLYFDWGTDGQLNNTLTYGAVGSGLSVINVNKLLTGLVCSNTYQFRARAVNSKGTTLGSVQQFTAAICPGCE